LSYSPAGLVPVPIDGDLAVWDSLAIVEYLHEKHPDRGIWPTEPAVRARARSLSAEMHAGFSALRQRLQMNCELRLILPALEQPVRRDIARVVELWSNCLARASGRGPFLFGAFSAADAFYAPVTRRFISYGVELPDVARRYVGAIEALPAMQAWLADAAAEHDFVPWEEPYRDGPT